MAAVDPNVYALSIQLQLESQAANDKLNEFTDILTDVEAKISASASRAFGSIADSFGKSIQSVSNTFDTAAKSSLDNYTKLVDSVGQDLIDNNKEIEKYEDTQESINDVIEERHKKTIELNDLHDRMETSTSMIGRAWANVKSITSGLHRAFTDSDNQVNNMFKGFINVGESLERKNDLLRMEAKLEEKSNVELAKMGDKAEKVKDAINSGVRAFRQMLASLQAAVQFFAELDKGAENFVTANYRMYGTQQALLNNTRMLSTELGISSEKAIEVVKALADVGTKKEDLEKLSRTVAMASRVTGIGATQLADYTRKLRTSGLSALSMEKHLATMTAGMRKFGLSTEDLNRILGKSNNAVATLSRMYGQDGLRAFNEFEMGMVGMAKQSGKSTEEVSAFFAKLADSDALLEFSAGLGVPIENLEKDLPKAMNAAALRLRPLAEELDRARKAGVGVQAAEIAFSASAKAIGMTATAAEVAVDRYNKLEAEVLRNGGAMDDLKAVTEAETKLLKEEMAEANMNVYAQLKMLGERFAWLGMIIQYITDSVGAFLASINYLLDLLTPAIVEVREFSNTLFPVGVVSKEVAFYIKAVVGALVVFGGALIFGSMSIATVVAALANLRLALATTQISTATFSTYFTATARAMATGFISVFRTFGMAFAAFGRAIQPVIIPLLQFGLAMALLGAAMLMTATGLYMLVYVPWDAMFKGFVIATVGVILLAVGLGILSFFGAAAVPVLLGIAAVAASIAAVFLAIGAAIYLAAAALALINTTIEKGLAKNLIKAAPALLYFGVVAAISSIGIALLGIAMTTVGYGAVMLAAAVFILVAAFTLLMKMVSPEQIRKMAMAFRDIAKILGPIALELLATAFVMIFVGLGFVIGGVILIIGSLLMLVGAFILSAAAGWLLIANEILKPITPELLMSAWDLFKIGLFVLVGGVGLFIGAIALLVGSIILIIAAIALGAAGVALRIAINLMIVAAEWLEKEGLQIQVGGEALKAGAEALRDGIPILREGASGMRSVASILKEAVKEMMDATTDLVTLAQRISYGGMYINFGAMSLYVGSVILKAAADMILEASNSFLTGVSQLNDGVGVLDAFSIGLLSTLTTFSPAVSQLRAMSADLLMSSFSLAVAGNLLLSAGNSMLSGATSIDASMLLLDSASTMMPDVAIGIMDGADQLNVALESLYNSALSMFYAGMMMYPASFSIFRAMFFLDLAINRFSRSIDSIVKLGQAMVDISTAFKTMAELPADKMRNAAQEALDTVPLIDKMGDALITIADKFNNINLGEAFDGIANQLEAYVTRVEALSERVWAAVNEKAVPALKAAEQAGIKEAVKSEAIQTVRVTSEDEAEDAGVSEETSIAQQQLEVLNELAESVKLMVPEGANPVNLILQLLQSYLPNIAKKDGGLTTEFNAWAR